MTKEITYKGKTYIKVPEADVDGCDGCAFEEDFKGCYSTGQEDCIDSIFTLKQEEQKNYVTIEYNGRVYTSLPQDEEDIKQAEEFVSSCQENDKAFCIRMTTEDGEVYIPWDVVRKSIFTFKYQEEE